MDRNSCDMFPWFTLAFPGFTAIVNKQLSAKYETLVDNAPSLIKVLPWGEDFEVDVFRKPDFTALEVVSFATGGTVLHILFTLSQVYARNSRWNQCTFGLGS